MADIEYREDEPAGEPEDIIALHLADTERQVGDAVETWLGSVRDVTIEPLVELFLSTARVYDELVEERAGISSHADSDAVERRIVEPFRERLAAVAPGQALEAAHERLLNELAIIADDVEDVVRRPEPAGLYARNDSDGPTRRFRKALVRAGRSLGRRASDQEVPVGRLTAYHVRVRIPGELQADHESVCRATERALTRASRALTETVHAVLAGDADAVDLSARLREAADLLAAVPPDPGIRERVRELDARLRRDAHEAGSFMLDVSERKVERASALRRRADERDALWRAWFERVESRIRLLELLLGLRRQAAEFEDRLIADVIGASIGPARAAVSRLAEELRTMSAASKKSLAHRTTARSVSSRLKKALEAVERDALSVMKDGRLQSAATAACDAVVLELSRTVQELPERLDVNILDEDVDPDRPPRRVEVREHAARAFDALLIERLRRATDAVAAAVAAAQAEAESVPGVLRFNLGTAVDDLEREATEDTFAAARELVVDGLARSADMMASAAGALDEVVPAFRLEVEEVSDAGFSSLHERIRVEERMREQMLDLRTGAITGMRQVVDRSTYQLRRAGKATRGVYRIGRRHVRRWVRIGRAAAGLAAATEEERLETIDALADTDRLLDRFPLVYRRLFTFAPVRDPSLLEGREAELRFVRRNVERWQRGLTNALVVTGFHGSGQTSFLNIVRRTVVDGMDVRTLDLRRRVRDEADLARLLSDALGMEPASSLERLGDALVADGGETQRVGIIEHIEHLYLRQVGGTRLIEQFLTFISRTDSRVMWVATVSDYGWQFIRSAEPSAAALVIPLPLAPVSRAGVEDIILNRHRRSGLPLQFEELPVEGNPLFHRRYRRARTEAERQLILRVEYFDRLHRASGQNIMLALLYWLRSVEMDHDGGFLRVGDVAPLQFGFLQAFGLDQAFTLKAFLEHASLTIEEHADVFQMPASRSLEIFEALGNLLLIEPMREVHGSNRFVFATIEQKVRYRIRPLLIHPVIQFLRGRNILH